MENSMAYSIPGVMTMDDIVAKAFEVSVKEIKTTDRKGPGKEGRFFAMWYLKQTTTLSLREIGEKYFRDHSTVIHACKQVDIWKENDKVFKAKFNEALDKLNKIKVN